MPRKRATSADIDNRIRAAKEISIHGNPSVISCFHCQSKGCPCIVMDSSSHKKCAECTRRGRPCVGITWESLDRVRSQLEAEIRETEDEQSRKLEEQSRLVAEQAAILTKLSRLRKTLRQSQDRAKAKTLCLVQELSDDGDEGAVDNPPTETLSQLFDSMPELWQSYPLSPSQSVEASSRNR